MSEITMFVKKFDKCPMCGSAERFYENLLRDIQERGLQDKKAQCFDFQVRQGIPILDQKIALLPFGSEIPSYNQIWDTCENCGMIYSTRLERGVAKKSLDIPQVPANRGTRRSPIGMNIPFHLPGKN